MTSRGDARARGLTIIELIIAISMVGITLAIAVPRSPKGAFALFEANQQVLGDLRLTRSHALTRGDHFQLKITSATAYDEYRMTFDGFGWVPQGAPIRSRVLPPRVAFVAGVGLTFEFDTRGLLTPPTATQTLVLQDVRSGHDRQITVWPSGQVGPL